MRRLAVTAWVCCVALELAVFGAMVLAAEPEPVPDDPVVVSKALLWRLLQANAILSESAETALDKVERLEKQIQALKVKLGCV